MSTEYLFVYGSLLTGTGVAAIDRIMRRHAHPVGPAFVPGRLYDMGDYPAATPARRAGERVFGRVYALPQGARRLKSLDRYEQYDPRRPRDSEFLRERVIASLLPARRPVACWIYYYKGNPPYRRRIRSGEYATGVCRRRSSIHSQQAVENSLM